MRDTVEASVRAASLKCAAGDAVGAFARLRAAAAANPANEELDVALVGGYVQARRPKEALDAWNVLQRKRPQDARTYDVLATIDRLNNDRGAARRSMQKAVELDPLDFTAIGGLAALDVDEHRVDDARDRLRRFIAANPRRIEATMQLVDIERAQGVTDASVLALLDAARRTDPRSIVVLRARATYFVEHDDSQQALAAADEGLAVAPADPKLLEIAGDAALATGNAIRATKVFKTLSAMNADAAEAPVRLGMAWLMAGDPEAALAAYRLALKRQADRVDLHRSMIGALLADGKAEEASRMLFEITRLAPKSVALPELDADVKLARRQYPEAIAAYRRALESTPSSQLVIRTVDALTRARQASEGNAVLAGWLKAHPTDEAVRAFDAEVALRTRDYARASDDFRALLRLRPNDPVLTRRLAASEARADDPQATSGVADRPSAPVARNASAQGR